MLETFAEAKQITSADELFQWSQKNNASIRFYEHNGIGRVFVGANGTAFDADVAGPYRQSPLAAAMYCANLIDRNGRKPSSKPERK